MHFTKHIEMCKLRLLLSNVHRNIVQRRFDSRSKCSSEIYEGYRFASSVYHSEA